MNLEFILKYKIAIAVENCERWIFRKLEGVVETGWSWLRIGTDGGHLWIR
jgi:hypothetical protein